MAEQIQDKLNVFISYARKDLLFVKNLVTALEQRGLQCKFDTRDLPSLEDWRRELLGLIQEADAVIFVVSSHSVASPICGWEVEQVKLLNKRLAPVIIEPVAVHTIPETLSSINFLYFDDEKEFEPQCNKLAVALRTDLIWVKEHTRLGQSALRWDARGRQRAFLLRGNELDEAERWQALPPRGAPAPTELHRDFIAESRQAWRRRQRLSLSISLAAAIVALGLAGTALWQRQIAVDNQHLADEQRGLAEQQREVADAHAKEAQQQRIAAENNERLANKERDSALLSQSRFLTDLGRGELRAGRTTRAALLALEALPDTATNRERPWYPPAEKGLLDALHEHQEQSLLLQNRGFVSAVEYFDSGRRFWSLSALVFMVWDAANRQPIYTITSGGNGSGSDSDFVGFTLSKDKLSGILAQHDGRLTFIDMATGRVTRTAKIVRLSMNKFTGDVDGRMYMVPRLGGMLVSAFPDIVSLSPDGKYLTALSEPDYDKKQFLADLYVYSIDNMSVAYHAAGLFGVSYPTGMAFSPDGRFLFTAGDRRSLVIDLDRKAPIATLELELLESTEDPRFSFMRTSAPGAWGYNGDANDPVGIFGTSVQPPNTVIFSYFLTEHRILLVLRGGEVAIWDIEQAARSTVWKANSGWFISAALSNHRTTLAIGTAEGKIVLFDIQEMKLDGEIEAHGSDIYSVKFGSDDETLLSISRDNTAKLWWLQDRAARVTMTGHRASTDATAPAPDIISASMNDLMQVVTGHSDGSLRTWSATSSLKPQIEDGNFGRWTSLRYTDDGRWLLVTEKNDLIVYDQTDPGHVRRLTGHQELIIRLVTDSTSTLAATSSLDGTVRLWNLASAATVQTFGAPLPSISVLEIDRDDTPLYIATRWQFARTITFSPDGKYLFIGRNNGIGEVRDCASGGTVASFGPRGEQQPGPDSFNPAKGIISGAFTPDGRHVIAGRLNGTFVVKSLVDHSFRAFVLESGNKPAGEVTGISVSPDGAVLSVTTASEPFSFITASTLSLALKSKYSGGTRQAGLELNGNLLQIDMADLLKGDIEARSYGPTTVSARGETEAEARSESGLKIDKDGTLNISGSEAVAIINNMASQQGRARQLDALGTELSRFAQHFGSISGITSFGTDALLSWSHDFTVRLWNLSDRSQRAVLVGANGDITGVVVSPTQGRRIAAAAGDKVLVWDQRNPTPLAIYRAPGQVSDIAYSPDGRQLAAATPGRLVLWDQFEGTQAVVEFAKSVLNRCLTRPERREFAMDETGPDWCIAQKKYPFRFARIGIQLKDLDRQERERLGSGGAIIAGVVGLPALAAGLRKGDVIFQVGSQPTGNVDQVTRAIMHSDIGRALEILIWRDGTEKKVVAYPGAED